MDYNKKLFEIIIVDDGSTDISVRHLHKLKQSNLKVISIVNNGAAFARNYAIEKSTHDVLVFLDQDVIVDTEILNVYNSWFSRKNISIVQGNIWEQTIHSKLTQLHRDWRRIVFLDKASTGQGEINTIVTRNVAIRRTVLKAIEKRDGSIFMEQFKGTGGEDRALGYRLHKAKFHIYLEPHAIVYHRDPDTFLNILKQKFSHAQGDVHHDIAERWWDGRNFRRAVLLPSQNGIPPYFALGLWFSHVLGAEFERLNIYLDYLRSQGYYFLKRSLDILGSFIGLLLGFPFLALISLLIKLDSQGPIFFKQRRVGKNGKEFYMYKFRTMVVNAEEILEKDPKLLELYKMNSYKIRNDPRVTRVGDLLRRSSMDELPQLINILTGEMSVVGPRAYKRDELEFHTNRRGDLKLYVDGAISIKPGLTGVWQTSGRSEIGFDDRIILDYEYSKRESILFDIYLIFKTVPTVLLSRGAW